jgi:hypothetical protein
MLPQPHSNPFQFNASMHYIRASVWLIVDVKSADCQLARGRDIKVFVDMGSRM